MAEHRFGPADEVKDRASRDREAARQSLVLEFADRPNNHSIMRVDGRSCSKAAR
jgi:hypothetical protein